MCRRVASPQATSRRCETEHCCAATQPLRAATLLLDSAHKRGRLATRTTGPVATARCLQTLISLGCLPLAPHSKVSQAWDFMMTLILLYVSLALPFEVAFLETPRGSRTWWINRVVDAVRALRPLLWHQSLHVKVPNPAVMCKQQKHLRCCRCSFSTFS